MTINITNYRDWIGTQSRSVRFVLFISVFVLLGVVGLAVETLQTTIGSLPTQILTWAVLLVALYTWYAIVRSAISN